MSDNKKAPEFLEDGFDWDAALDDWEKKSFLTEPPPAKGAAEKSDTAKTAPPPTSDVAARSQLKTPPLVEIPTSLPPAEPAAGNLGSLPTPAGTLQAEELFDLSISQNEVPTAPPPADSSPIPVMAVPPPPPAAPPPVAPQVPQPPPAPMRPQAPVFDFGEAASNAIRISTETVEASVSGIREAGAEEDLSALPMLEEVEELSMSDAVDALDSDSDLDAFGRETKLQDASALLVPAIRTVDPDEETTVLNAANPETIKAVTAHIHAAKAAAAAASAAPSTLTTVEIQSVTEMDADEELKLLAELAELEGAQEGAVVLRAGYDDEVDTGVFSPDAPDIEPTVPKLGTLPPIAFPPAARTQSSLPPGSWRTSIAPDAPPSLPPPLPSTHTGLEGERPATEWMSDDVRAAMDERSRWLEEEARATRDRIGAARSLLVVSELRAMLGDAAGAERLAAEARDAWPQLTLPHRQTRGLGDGADSKTALDRLDASVRSAPTPEGKLHDLLLAAEVARATSAPEDVLRKRWDQAWRAGTTDVRVILGRAGLALANDEAGSSALRVPDGEGLAPLADAIGAALRTRSDGKLPADAAKADPASPTFAPEILRRVRAAMGTAKGVGAAAVLAELREVPELATAASWLSAALAAATPTTRANALTSLAQLHEPAAMRMRAAVGLELGDAEVVRTALLQSHAFSPDERLVIGLLLEAGAETSHLLFGDLAGLGEEFEPLGAAAAALSGGDETKTAGAAEAKRAILLGRRLSRRASAEKLEEIVRERADDAPEETRALKLEVAFRASRWADLADDLSAWSGGARPGDGFLAAALVAERTGDTERAARAYRQAMEADPANETALRAYAALDPQADVSSVLWAMAEGLKHGTRAALAAIEAVVRGDQRDDETKLEMLDFAHRAAPELPLASFIAERIARRNGAILDVLRWVRERRAVASDPLEGALDAVREALLVADGDPALAAERLEEAHRARPGDVALRDLYERLALEPPADRAAWREERAAEAEGTTKRRWLLEAAHEYERLGDRASALRAATAARTAATDESEGLERIVLERNELLAGEVSRLSDELLAVARSAEDPIARREAFERLADLDATDMRDTASALLWHRSILEDAPDYKVSLRYVEQALLSDGRDDEFEPFSASLARVLAGTPGGEAAAHAGLAARLRMRRGDWALTGEMAALGTTATKAPLWALRLANAHARISSDAQAELAATKDLLTRATRTSELSSLLLRAAHAAITLGGTDEAKELLERATTEDPSDIVAWERLAETRYGSGDPRGAALAYESVARASAVQPHRLAAWYRAGQVWADDVHDDERAVVAFEEAARLDVTHSDIFVKLSALYVKRGAQTELASLLERRAATVQSPEERIALDVERGRVLAEVGDPAAAKLALQAALEAAPDHVGALRAHADVSANTGDWAAAEQSWVRLARLIEEPEEQAAIYERLGELYADRTVNLDRAEVAYQEVLKRRPESLGIMSRLVELLQRKGDLVRALEMQKDILGKTTDPVERRTRLMDRAAIYENAVKDTRKAEQTLESARRELPGDVTILRALAEFYTRHKQMPAVHILLDRAAADARRAFAAGRVVPQMFETMQVVCELRGKKEAALVVEASLNAFTGKPANIHGAEARAGDPRLDEVLAPDVVIPALRALLARTGDALDAAVPFDPRTVRAVAPSATSSGMILAQAHTLAAGMGLSGCQILVSPEIGSACIPVSSSPPIIIVGEKLLSAPNPLGKTFLLARALKLVQARASAFLRIPAKDLPVMFGAYLHVFNPNWKPQGVNPQALAEAAKRLQSALPRKLDQDVGLMALEVAGSVGTHSASLGQAVLAWADRTGLLAVGDPNAALDAIAWTMNLPKAPTDPEQRAAWIAKTREVGELLGFSVSDGYTEARARAGLGGRPGSR